MAYGFTLEGTDSLRAPCLLDETTSKIDTVHCILLIATAVLVGTVKSIHGGSSKSP